MSLAEWKWDDEQQCIVLPSRVTGIVADDDGNLIVATETGLSRIALDLLPKDWTL